jgi:hypothetical protein
MEKNWNYLVELKLYVGVLKDNRKEEAEEDQTLQEAVCDCQEDIVLQILCCIHYFYKILFRTFGKKK